MEIRLFDEQELESVLNLCNQHMEFDRLSETLLREKLFDDPFFNPELIFTAYDAGQLIGFLAGVTRELPEGKVGYVKLMVVHSQFRRNGVGRALYQKLESELVRIGMQKVRVYDVPFNYFMPGIDPRYTPAVAFFETLGFKRVGETANMMVDLENQDFPTAEQEEKLSREGVEITRADYTDHQAIMEFVEQYYPLWRYEVANAYNSLPISLHIARHNGEIKAFSAHNGNNFGTGWFGPMATLPEWRGKGIGGVLLRRCLQDMKEWGLTESVIPWVGPVRFYAYYANARVSRVFWRYEKNLQADTQTK